MRQSSSTTGDPYPRPAVEAGHIEAAPRRVRGLAGGQVVFDTCAAHYVWEWPFYPQYYIASADVDLDLLVDGGEAQQTELFGTARRHGLRVGGDVRAAVALVHGPDAPAGVADAVRFDWDALDAWYEEDEQIFVHPRNPYVRVDALRSTRRVRVEADGVVLAESAAPVLVFETGLPTRFYLDRSAVNFEHLLVSDTETPCPYKGRTSNYWSARVNGATHDDVAWSYDFPTRQLLSVTGLVAFYDERVDTFVDGVLRERPRTHFA